MTWQGWLMGVIAILIAIVVPLWIEWVKRPKLRVCVGADADRDNPRWRIVHVRVVNRPTRIWPSRYLLREDASGCTARVTLISRFSGAEIPFAGKWSSTPEPILVQAIGNRIVEFYDPQKLPAALVATVPPTADGQSIAIAIKHGGDSQAYGFGPELYAAPDPGPLRTPQLALEDSEYEVHIEVTAGATGAKGYFILYNRGRDREDIELAELPKPARRKRRWDRLVARRTPGRS